MNHSLGNPLIRPDLQWEGVHSLFPEMVLLPQWFPIHTHRMWSYCRTVYMPMSWIYGMKFAAPEDELIRTASSLSTEFFVIKHQSLIDSILLGELRKELIFEPYEGVDWRAARDFIAQEDLYTPHTLVLDTFYKLVNFYEKFAFSWLRQKALDWVYAVLE